MTRATSILTLGAGNMASALLAPMAGLLDEFLAYTPSGTKAKALAHTMGGHWLNDLNDLGTQCDDTGYPLIPSFIFLSFKPQQFVEASKDLINHPIWPKWGEESVIVSMLAGVPLEVLQERFKSDQVVRIMPNTPALVGQGITLLLAPDSVDKTKLAILYKLLEQAGPVFQCQSEEQLDAVTAVTGSGPAYVFEFTRILQNFLVSKGLSNADARNLAINLVSGSAELMASQDTELEILRNNVTSKNGVTEAALNSLKDNQLEAIFVQALEKNIERSFELRTDALKINKS